MERKTGFEPATSSLARMCSANLSYFRLFQVVPRVRIELTTPAFSVLCSTY